MDMESKQLKFNEEEKDAIKFRNKMLAAERI